jgi:hypothetical protein
MTQIILDIKDDSILPALEKTLSLLKGVKVEKVADGPNQQTRKAINEAKAGNVVRSKGSKEMFASLKK